MKPDRWVSLGVLGRARGLDGECWFRPFNTDSDALASGSRVRLVRVARDSTETVTETTVTRVAHYGNSVALAFEGTHDRDAAETLTNSTVELRRSDFTRLSPGEFYHTDLIGLPVCTHDKTPFGTVTRVISYPTVDALEVSTATGTIEIPLTDGHVSIIDPNDCVTLSPDFSSDV